MQKYPNGSKVSKKDKKFPEPSRAKPFFGSVEKYRTFGKVLESLLSFF